MFPFTLSTNKITGSRSLIFSTEGNEMFVVSNNNINMFIYDEICLKFIFKN